MSTVVEFSNSRFEQYSIYYSFLSGDTAAINNSFGKIQKFDPNKGVAFASFVINHMKRAVETNPASGDQTVFYYSLYALDVTDWENFHWNSVKRTFTRAQDFLEDYQYNHIVDWITTHNQNLLLNKPNQYRGTERVVNGFIPENIWMILGNIKGLNISDSRQIDTALLSLQVGNGVGFDLDSYNLVKDGSRWISPILLKDLSHYPGFQYAPLDWIAVDSLSTDQSAKYKKMRNGIKMDVQIENLQYTDYCNEAGSKAYLQYLHMKGNSKGIAWFYNPETRTVKEYCSPEMLPS